MLQLIATNIARLDADTGGTKSAACCKLSGDATSGECSDEFLQPHHAIDKHLGNIDESC